jgi:hypothetical protein
VARANITANSDSTDSATYTTASITLKAGRLYIAAIENSHGTSASAVSAITGGPTFSAAPATSTTLYNSNLNRISLWTAVPTVDYTGTLTIAFGGTTQTGCVWAINELSGVDTTTNNGIVQSAVGTGTSTTPLATLAAFGSANNATFAAHGVVNTSGFTPGTGFTELSDTTAATPAQGMETEWRVDNDTTADATVTSGAWGSVAVEIKADAGSFIIPPSTPGNPDIYMGMTVTGVTATFLRVSATAGLLQSAGHIGISGTQVCLPSSGTASAVTTGVVALPLAGFSSRTLLA